MAQSKEQWKESWIEGVMESFEKEAAGDDRFFERIAPALGCRFDLLQEPPAMESGRRRPVRARPERDQQRVGDTGGKGVVKYRFSFA